MSSSATPYSPYSSQSSYSPYTATSNSSFSSDSSLSSSSLSSSASSLSGPSLYAYNISQITLPPTHQDFMTPQGPLTPYTPTHGSVNENEGAGQTVRLNYPIQGSLSPSSFPFSSSSTPINQQHEKEEKEAVSPPATQTMTATDTLQQDSGCCCGLCACCGACGCSDIDDFCRWSSRPTGNFVISDRSDTLGHRTMRQETNCDSLLRCCCAICKIFPLCVQCCQETCTTENAEKCFDCCCCVIKGFMECIPEIIKCIGEANKQDSR